jgi:plasmid stabilization system protein ParE
MIRAAPRNQAPRRLQRWITTLRSAGPTPSAAPARGRTARANSGNSEIAVSVRTSAAIPLAQDLRRAVLHAAIHKSRHRRHTCFSLVSFGARAKTQSPIAISPLPLG